MFISLQRHIACLFVMGLCLWALQAEAAELTVNRVVAVVNGEAITAHDLQKRTAAEMNRMGLKPDDPKGEPMRKQALDSLINDILLRQEASRYKITVDDNDVNTEVKRIRENMGNLNQQQFEAQLARQGMTVDTVKDQLRNNMLRQKIISFMISRKVIVTRDEVVAYFEAHKEDFARGKEADFSLIIFPPKFNAKDMYAKLKSGEANFEATARQYSVDNAAQNGGRIKGAAWGALSENMRKLLESLSPGQLSPLIPFHGANVVVRLNGISEGKSPTLEDAFDQIEQHIKEPRMQERFEDYTRQLRQKAVIDIK